MSEQELVYQEQTALEPHQDRGMSAFSSKNNFEDALRMGNMLAKSNMVPQQYQNNVPNCVIALEMANRIGASVFAVMQNLAIVHGKPAFEAKFIIGALNSSRRFSPLRFEITEPGPEEKVSYTYFVKDSSGKSTARQGAETIRDRVCYAWAMERSGTRIEGPRVSIRMAVEEGWYSKPGSKWKTMPELMLRYRAASFFGKLYAPDVLMGMQTAEEMHDIYEAQTSTTGPDKVYEVDPQAQAGSRTASLKEKLKSKANQSTAPLETAPPPASPDHNPQLVDAILKAIAASKTTEELDEAEDLIRELKNSEDKAKCQEALEHKRQAMAEKNK